MIEVFGKDGLRFRSAALAVLWMVFPTGIWMSIYDGIGVGTAWFAFFIAVTALCVWEQNFSLYKYLCTGWRCTAFVATSFANVVVLNSDAIIGLDLSLLALPDIVLNNLFWICVFYSYIVAIALVSTAMPSNRL